MSPISEKRKRKKKYLRSGRPTQEPENLRHHRRLIGNPLTIIRIGNILDKPIPGRPVCL